MFFFTDVLSSWKDTLVSEVENADIDNEIAKCIPVVPAGYEIRKLFPNDKSSWVDSLWHACAARRNPLPIQPVLKDFSHNGMSK